MHEQFQNSNLCQEQLWPALRKCIKIIDGHHNVRIFALVRFTETRRNVKMRNFVVLLVIVYITFAQVGVKISLNHHAIQIF